MSDRQLVIPAQPGWSIVEPWIDDSGERGVSFDTIIAWLVEITDRGPRVDEIERYYALTKPITADTGSSDEDHILKDPNGRMFLPFDRDLRTMDDVYDYLIEKRKKEAEHNAALEAARALRRQNGHDED